MKFSHYFVALLFVSSSQLAFAETPNTLPSTEQQPNKTFDEWVKAARAASNSDADKQTRSGEAAGYFLKASEIAPDNTLKYWALVEAGREFEYGEFFQEALTAYTQAEKIPGISNIARLDAGLHGAYALRQVIKSKPGEKDFSPAHASYRRLFALPELEPFHRKLIHGCIGWVYSDEGKYIEAALEYEKGEKLHAATDDGYLGAAITELEQAKPNRAALPIIDRIFQQILKRKTFDSKKLIYRAKNQAELKQDKSRWSAVKTRHNVALIRPVK